MAEKVTEARQTVLDGFLCGRANPEAIIKTLADVDPEGPPPEADPPARPANLADVRKVMSESQWLWDLYIPAARIAGIAAFEGVGKTRFAMDLARRIWFGLPWPDGQPATFPERTPTLWVCADGQQDDLAAAAEAFGMPDEAIYFNTLPDDPYGGTELDEARVPGPAGRVHRPGQPGLVFIDTLTNATSRDLCRANENKALMTPLRDIAQRTQTTIIPLLHLSKEGQALGRRIKGITRTILQTRLPRPRATRPVEAVGSEVVRQETPGPRGDDDRRRERVRLQPADRPRARQAGTAPRGPRRRPSGSSGSPDPRERPDRERPVPPSGRRPAGSEKTFWRAVDEMEEAGELTKDGGPGTGKQIVLHLIPEPEPGPSSDRPS